MAADENIVEGNDLLFDVDLTCPIELAPLAVSFDDASSPDKLSNL